MDFSSINFHVDGCDSELASRALRWHQDASRARIQAGNDRHMTADERACWSIKAEVFTTAANMVINGGKSRPEIATVADRIRTTSDDPKTRGAWHNLLTELTHEPLRIAKLAAKV